MDAAKPVNHSKLFEANTCGQHEAVENAREESRFIFALLLIGRERSSLLPLPNLFFHSFSLTIDFIVNECSFHAQWHCHFNEVLLAPEIVARKSSTNHFWPREGERVLPYMGYIGMCREMGYGFWGSRSLHGGSFLLLLVLFLEWSLDRVPKLYRLKLQRKRQAKQKRNGLFN